MYKSERYRTAPSTPPYRSQVWKATASHCDSDPRVGMAGKRVACEWLLLNGDYQLDFGTSSSGEEGKPHAAQAAAASPTAAGGSVARCVCILDRKLIGGEDENLVIASFFPPSSDSSARAVFVLQLDAAAAVCPDGKVLLHLCAEGCAGKHPRDILQPVLTHLLQLAASRAAAATPAPAHTSAVAVGLGAAAPVESNELMARRASELPRTQLSDEDAEASHESVGADSVVEDGIDKMEKTDTVASSSGASESAVTALEPVLNVDPPAPHPSAPQARAAFCSNFHTFNLPTNKHQ